MLIVPMATMGLSREKGALSPWRTSLWEFERATPTDESGRVFLPSAVARSCHQLVGPDSAYTSNLSRSVKVLDFVKSGGPDWTKSRSEADSRVTPSLGMGMVYVSVASSPVTSMPSTKLRMSALRSGEGPLLQELTEVRNVTP